MIILLCAHCRYYNCEYTEYTLNAASVTSVFCWLSLLTVVLLQDGFDVLMFSRILKVD